MGAKVPEGNFSNTGVGWVVIPGFGLSSCRCLPCLPSLQVLTLSFFRSGGGGGGRGEVRGPAALDWLGPDVICHPLKSMHPNNLHNLCNSELHRRLPCVPSSQLSNNHFCIGSRCVVRTCEQSGIIPHYFFVDGRSTIYAFIVHNGQRKLTARRSAEDSNAQSNQGHRINRRYCR